jgi:hypothetical protein
MLFAFGGLTAGCHHKSHKHPLSTICLDAVYGVSFSGLPQKEVQAPFVVLNSTDTMIMAPYLQGTDDSALAHLSYEPGHDSRKIILTNGKEIYTGIDPADDGNDSTKPAPHPMGIKLMTPKEYKQFLTQLAKSQGQTITGISASLHANDVRQLKPESTPPQ